MSVVGIDDGEEKGSRFPEQTTSGPLKEKGLVYLTQVCVQF